jgi:hypothetical protein
MSSTKTKMANTTRYGQAMSVAEVRDLVDRAGVSQSRFWSLAAGGDQTPMAQEDVERVLAELQVSL